MPARTIDEAYKSRLTGTPQDMMKPAEAADGDVMLMSLRWRTMGELAASCRQQLMTA